MAIYKCKMCGGDLEIKEGATICECEFCGTKQTVPTAKTEALANLFNRANKLRIKCEFDKAEEIYEKILGKDETLAEAHWGLVLCKYGIEYVEDPATETRVPTCHRTSYESVTSDTDYLSAVEYADSEQKKIYKEEAKVIEGIQKRTLEIVKNEKPFDVFICYKETDKKGKRTVDSTYANDIYHQLTNEGFKVFFAAITLEDKLGQEYEPYIFAALNSAKVMLVIGTNEEYFNAIWVKNEWSRFLKLMKTDRSKLLIPCYKDIDPYDLPEEFAHLQAQDMGKIGFVQDLLRGIKKVVKPEEKTTTTTIIQNSIDSVEPLLRRAFMFLEDGDFNSAREYAEKVLDVEPENGEGYLIKLMTDLSVKRRNELGNCQDAFNENSNYQKAIRFGKESLIKELNGYIKSINDRNVETYYNQIVSEIPDAIKKEDFEKIVTSLEKIATYKDSSEKIEFCENKIKEISKASEVTRNKRKRVFTIILASLVLIVVFAISLITFIIPGSKYNSAEEALESGNYQEAIDVLSELGSFSDSSEKIKEIYNQSANDIIKNCDVGDTVLFGTFEQDAKTKNGSEVIEWIVLEKTKNRILVISKYVLDGAKYNTEHNVPYCVTWENCTLRKWLNNTFYIDAFTDEEKSKIAISTVPIDDVNYTEQVNATVDKVFLLSITEAEKYFNDHANCQPTSYAVANGVYENDYGNCQWWLRSCGSSVDSAAIAGLYGLINESGQDVDSDGDFYDNGDYVDYGLTGIRPAMWINVE